MPTEATLIGDVIQSRLASGRKLHAALTEALRVVNERLRPVQRVRSTVGDEFQGSFATVGRALRASLVIRLELLARAGADSRYGIGYGKVTVYQQREGAVDVQDGPGWWRARDAIERAEQLQESPQTGFVRSRFASAKDPTRVQGVDAEVAVNAFLMTRDALIDAMTDRERRLLLGLLNGVPQAKIGEQEGISQSAVSQALRRSRAHAIAEAHALFDRGGLF